MALCLEEVNTSFYYWRPFLFSVSGYYKWCRYKHLHTGLVINIHVHFFCYLSRRELAGSYVVHIFRFCRCCQSIFQNGCAIGLCFLPYENSSGSITLARYLVSFMSLLWFLVVTILVRVKWYLIVFCLFI